MTPRLVACHFGGNPRRDVWARLARVLERTAADHCGHWSREIQSIVPRPMHSAIGIPSHVHNTQKMEHWAAAVAAAKDGEQLLLIDTDTFIRHPLDDVWAEPFDFGYTTKVSKFPFNSGVVFLRVSPAVRAFIEVWRRENRRMLSDRRHHEIWRAKFGGINQASLGYALAAGEAQRIAIREFPCVTWNCEDSSWSKCDASTRIVHVKGLLRKAIFDRVGLAPEHAAYIRPLKDEWLSLEAATLAKTG